MRLFVLVVVSAVFCFGMVSCKKGGGGPTKAAFQDLRKEIKPFDAFDGALKKIEAKIGKATKTEGTKQIWIAKEGEECTQYSVENLNGKVGATGTQSVSCPK